MSAAEKFRLAVDEYTRATLEAERADLTDDRAVTEKSNNWVETKAALFDAMDDAAYEKALSLISSLSTH